jgi:hypothetical protein
LGYYNVMNYIKMAIAIVAIVASAVAQARKETPEKPNLSVSFAKSGLKALLAIGNFKGTGSLTGPARSACDDARSKTNSASAPETLMIANLLDFAIMRSADNLARENIMLKATAKLADDGEQPNANLLLEKAQKEQELSEALSSIDKRESECLKTLEKAFRNRIAIPLPGMCSK